MLLNAGDGEHLVARPLVVEITDVDVERVGEFALDVYKAPFVPEEYRYINSLPARPYPGIPPPTPKYHHISQSLMPTYPINLLPYATSMPALPHIEPLYNPPPNTLPPISTTHYERHFAHLCAAELAARIREMEEYSLYNHPIESLDPGRYLIVVPGIRENKPFLRVGDVVSVRRCPLANFDGIEFEGYITAMNKKEGKIFVNMSPYFTIKAAEEFPALNAPRTEEKFNIRFIVNADSLRSMTRALAYLQSLLGTISNPPQRSLARKWLFPEVTDGVDLPPDEMPRVGLDFTDRMLNWEQKIAVESIVKNNYGDVPYVIWGPPGTGKTKTLIEAILQTIKHHPTAHILAVAPSNSAADTITLRLLPHLTPHQLIRLNSPSRTFAEVRDALMPFCMINSSNVTGGAFFDLDVSRVVKASVVVMTCDDARGLFESGLGNWVVGSVWEAYHREMGRLYPLLHPEGVGSVRRRHWTVGFEGHVFLDEAGQASEPELSDTLSLILTPDAHLPPTTNLFPQPRCQFILCGDVKQLGPFIQSNYARAKGLDVSLMERLMGRDLYSEDVRKRSGEFRVGDVGVVVLKREPFVRLKCNYRSHPGILMMPSTLFYTTTLEVFASHKLTHALLPPLNNNLHNLFPTSLPVLFSSIVGPDDRAHDGGGWWNVSEAVEVKRVVMELVVNGGVAAGDVGVMCAFREQVRVVRHVLRGDKRLRGVDVGTVEDYQGQERLVTVLSTVRSQQRFVEDDIRTGSGVVGQPKRLNVAFTRAQAGLIIVGNPHVLSHDENWRNLLLFYCKHNLTCGTMPKTIMDEAARSRSDSLSPTSPYRAGQLEKGHNYAMRVMQTGPREWLGSAAGEWGDAVGEDERELEWSVHAVREVLEEWRVEDSEGASRGISGHTHATGDLITNFEQRLQQSKNR
ncbi:hypothetical protein HDV00_005116 [Rhizophlyctis rosea]|nr:hypothetical protein HDV00_005116 [Rhizophlyctis rosea]